MVYSHISYNSPTGAYSYYETRRTPFRSPYGSSDILVSSRSSEMTPSGDARRHRNYSYRSVDTSGPYNHQIETWIEPVTTRSSRSSARASSCSRALTRRSLSRNREHSTSRADRLLRDHMEREPHWIKSEVSSIKNDINRFLERADQKQEDYRDKDYRSTWVKEEMSAIRNDVKDLQEYAASPRSQIKRLEDEVTVHKFETEMLPRGGLTTFHKFESEMAPMCVDLGARARCGSVSRFNNWL